MERRRQDVERAVPAIISAKFRCGRQACGGSCATGQPSNHNATNPGCQCLWTCPSLVRFDSSFQDLHTAYRRYVAQILRIPSPFAHLHFLNAQLQVAPSMIFYTGRTIASYSPIRDRPEPRIRPLEIAIEPCVGKQYWPWTVNDSGGGD